VIHHDHQPPQQSMTATFSALRQRRDVAVLVPAAGSGLRLGGARPKALHELGGIPLLVHCLRNVAAAGGVGMIVVAAPPDAVDEVRALVTAAISDEAISDEACSAAQAGGSGAGVGAGDKGSDEGQDGARPEAIVVAGGASRQESVAAALAAVPPEFDVILVHDAARALTPPELIEAVADAVRAGHDAVIPGLPVVDTIKQIDADGRVITTIDRERLRAVQTPQGFRRSVLTKAHAVATDCHTDDAGMVERLGVAVHTVPGHPHAIKITTPGDLVIAEAIIRAGR
jgi:2-C-methyl-D-erythritol 4-phosphate cytidylyltransferase